MSVDMTGFRFWCQKVLPAIYDDSLSYYEVLCKLTKYVEENMQDVADVNEAVIELKNYVDNYFESLDVQTAIDNTIQELIDNGTIGDIIKESVAGVDYQKIATISRIGRILDPWGLNDTTRVLYSQCCCYNDNKYYVCGNKNSENTEQGISVWNATGVLLNSESYTQLGHANDVCYYDGKLYIATSTACGVVDANTLEYIGSISRGDNIDSLRAICTDGEYIYFIGETTDGYFGINKYDPINETNETIFTGLKNIGNVPQGCEYYNGAFYMLFNQSNAVGKFDAETGELKYVYMIPSDDGYFYTGEQEDLFIANGIMHLMCAGSFLEATYATSALCQLFETDIVSIITPKNSQDYIEATTPVSVTVNNSATYEFNPYLTFIAVEELNLLKRETIIRCANVSSGCLVKPHTRGLNVIRTSGTVRFSRIRCYGGTHLFNNITIDSLYAEASVIEAQLCTIESMSIRFGEIRLNNSTVNDIITIERSKVETDYTALKSTTVPSASSSKIVMLCDAVTLANIYGFKNNLNNLYAGYSANKSIIFKIGVQDSSGNVYMFAKRITVSAIANDIVFDDGNNNTLTISNNAVVLTVNEVTTTINSVLYFDMTV